MVFGDAGVRPGSRAIAWCVPKGATFVVEAKVAKTMLAEAWPVGFPARFADSGGVQTRGACPETSEGLKHCPPFLRSRLHCSATPQGQGGLPKTG